MIALQTVTDIKNIVATDNATITGILIAVIIALGLSLIYLFKANQSLYKEYIAELRVSNEQLVQMVNSYNEFVRIIERQNKGL